MSKYLEETGCISFLSGLRFPVTGGGSKTKIFDLPYVHAELAPSSDGAGSGVHKVLLVDRTGNLPANVPVWATAEDLKHFELEEGSDNVMRTPFFSARVACDVNSSGQNKINLVQISPADPAVVGAFRPDNHTRAHFGYYGNQRATVQSRAVVPLGSQSHSANEKIELLMRREQFAISTKSGQEGCAVGKVTVGPKEYRVMVPLGTAANVQQFVQNQNMAAYHMVGTLRRSVIKVHAVAGVEVSALEKTECYFKNWTTFNPAVEPAESRSAPTPLRRTQFSPSQDAPRLFHTAKRLRVSAPRDRHRFVTPPRRMQSLDDM